MHIENKTMVRTKWLQVGLEENMLEFNVKAVVPLSPYQQNDDELCSHKPYEAVRTICCFFCLLGFYLFIVQFCVFVRAFVCVCVCIITLSFIYFFTGRVRAHLRLDFRKDQRSFQLPEREKRVFLGR